MYKSAKEQELLCVLKRTVPLVLHNSIIYAETQKKCSEFYSATFMMQKWIKNVVMKVENTFILQKW